MPILQDSQPSLHRNFCISAQGAIAHPYVKPMDLASVLSLARIRGFGKSCARFDRSWSLANRTSAMAEPIALGPSRVDGSRQSSPALGIVVEMPECFLECGNATQQHNQT